MPNITYKSYKYGDTPAAKKYLRYDAQRGIFKMVEADADGFTILEIEMTRGEAEMCFGHRVCVDAELLSTERVWPSYVEIKEVPRHDPR